MVVYWKLVLGSKVRGVPILEVFNVLVCKGNSNWGGLPLGGYWLLGVYTNGGSTALHFVCILSCITSSLPNLVPWNSHG